MNTVSDRDPSQSRERAGQMMPGDGRSPTLSKGGNTTAAVRAELPVSEYAKSKQSANISNTQASGGREGAARG